MMKENLWNTTDRGNNSSVTKTCRTVTLRTTHATCNSRELNPGLNDDIPSIIRPSNSMATWSLSCVCESGNLVYNFLAEGGNKNHLQ
jgi:hypothetical protein